MSAPQELRFTVSDRTEGHEVTPETVPLGLLKDFVADVSAFIRGDDREIETSDLLMSIQSGSLAIQSHGRFSDELSIWRDVEQLSKGLLDGVDAKRARIAEKWRQDALRRPTRTFQISDGSKSRIVVINSNSLFIREDESSWAIAERYLSGVVEDFGGATSPNIHLRLPDGSTLKIDATKEQIGSEERNPVYHTVLVRVEVEENVETGEMRNARFLGFASYSPRVDEEDYLRATEAGRAAWSDVDDPSEWVRQIRGGD